MDVQLHSPNREVFAKKTCRTFDFRYVNKKPKIQKNKIKNRVKKFVVENIYKKFLLQGILKGEGGKRENKDHECTL